MNQQTRDEYQEFNEMIEANTRAELIEGVEKIALSGEINLNELIEHITAKSESIIAGDFTEISNSLEAQSQLKKHLDEVTIAGSKYLYLDDKRMHQDIAFDSDGSLDDVTYEYRASDTNVFRITGEIDDNNYFGFFYKKENGKYIKVKGTANLETGNINEAVEPLDPSIRIPSIQEIFRAEDRDSLINWRNYGPRGARW